MIMWLEADGKAKLGVDDWNGSGKWSSGTKSVKVGGRIERRVGPSGNVEVSGTFNRSGPVGPVSLGPVLLSW